MSIHLAYAISVFIYILFALLLLFPVKLILLFKEGDISTTVSPLAGPILFYKRSFSYPLYINSFVGTFVVNSIWGQDPKRTLSNCRQKVTLLEDSILKGQFQLSIARVTVYAK